MNDITILKEVSKGADVRTLEKSVLTGQCKEKDKENCTKTLYTS